MSPSKRDQRINDILTATKQILDSAKDPLCLVPIPGLPAAVSALSTIINIILVARGNDDTREDLANTIKNLTSVIEETRKKAESVLGTDDDNLTRTRLVSSPELNQRVATLEKDLKDLASDANNLNKGLSKFLLSKKNSDVLLKIKTGIDDATTKFQIQGGITVEMLINGIVNDIEIIKRRQQQELYENALEKLAPVNAGYTSGLNPTTSGTLQGTRTALLEELTEWTLRSGSDQDGSFMYAISGGAGTGKSTIAFEMAHRLEEVGALGASFFFVRGAEKLNTTTHVLRTIAYQLAHNQTDLYPHIATAAREYTRRGKRGEQLQVDLEDLIIKPLMKVHSSHHPIILVLDALDECTKAGQNEIVRLLYLLMQQLPKIPFPVRVLVTSRPEMHIQDALDDDDIRKVSKPLKLHEIQRVIVDADIKLFLEARLKVLKCYRDVCDACPNVIEDLTERAAGLFIYADTVVKFLARNPYHAVIVLKAILSDNPLDAAFSLKNLDMLYIAILQNALDDTRLEIPHMKEYIQVVLGSLALLQDHMSTTVLQDLVDIPMSDIQDILSRLGSVILKPETDDIEIRVLHASFPQFLIDIHRCTDPKFYINPLIHQRRLASTCLEVMTASYPLKRNICELEDPTIMKSDIPDLHDISRCIPASLQYSCAHWATHLSLCDDPDRNLLKAVTEFVRTKLLVWVETLSYMGRLELAVPALLAMLSWCEVNMQDDDDHKYEVLQLIDDTHRIVLQCYIPINDCPEHLYISSPLLAPSYVNILQHNNSDNHPAIKAVTPRESAWGACLHKTPMYSVDCRAMLSPDGSLIASGSRTGQVCIWDASIGLSKRTLAGHIRRVLCVAWSPNGQSLASGSTDGTIRVWNPTSGAQVHVQGVQSRKCEVYALVWSRDGRQLVTAAMPGGIKVWDIVVGKELKGSITVPSIGTVKTISKGARRAVDLTARNKLRIWDIECTNGRILKELPVQFYVYSAVLLHNDTQVAFCGRDKAIHVWDLESGESTPKFELRSGITLEGKTTIYGIALSHNQNILAAYTGGKIYFFNTKSWDLLGSIQGYFHLTASFSPDDRRLLASYATIDMWDLTSVLAPKPQIIPPTSPIIKHDTAISFVTISLDGERVATVSRGTVSIWSLKSGLQFCSIQGYFTDGTTFSPDTRKIVVGESSKISIWDITTTQPTLMRSILTANRDNDKLTWSPNGLWIASAAYGPSNTRGLGVFDAVTGEQVKYLVLSNQEVLWDVEFSRDNTMLYARCGSKETIFRWKEGEQVNLEQHRWETVLKQRKKFLKDAWIIRQRDGKKLCWVQQLYSERFARWGDYYAVGQDSGRLDIFHIEDSSVY